MNRQCGGCTLCCKLLPVRELHKGAGERCQHQRAGRGCAIYRAPNMPLSCALWSCRWLSRDDTGGLSRPDRAHYVLDIMPDYITATDNATGNSQTVECIQIWVDPKYPGAHRDPALRAYLYEQAAKFGTLALVRYNNKSGFVLIAPPMNSQGVWIEHAAAMGDKEHSAAQIFEATGKIF